MFCRSLILAGLLFLPATVPLQAETPVGVSIRAGVYTNGWFPEVYGREMATDGSARRTAGVSAEVRFTQSVALEGTALYRRIESYRGGGYSFAGFRFDSAGHLWEFPVLAKIRLPKTAGLRPFALAGPSFARVSFTEWGAWTTLVPGPGGSPVSQDRSSIEVVKDTINGFVIGGGAEKNFGLLRLTADVRWTFWNGRKPVDFGGGATRPPTPLLILFGVGF